MRLLADDREAAEARVEMVLGAREEVLASAFIVGDDDFSLTSMALLRAGARRGLRVQVLVDAQWHRLPRAVVAHLLAEGVEIREFHPFRLDRLGWIFRRMHDKLVVVDGRVALAGGRNVQSPYFGLGRQIERRDYLDLDLQVIGGAAQEARAYFRRNWASRHVQEVRARATPGELADAERELDRHMRWLDDRIGEALADPRRRPPRREEVGPVQFLHDPIGERRQRGVARELRDLLAEARESVLVESPYLIPSRALRRILLDAVARGVRIRILTNSLATTDNLWPQAAYAGDKQRLVALGVELWETMGDESLHTKAAVIDGATAVVGSFNLDPRSQRLNTELALVIDDPALAAELNATMDGHLAAAARIGPDGRPEGYDERYPGVSRCKVWKMRLMRPLAALFRGQL